MTTGRVMKQVVLISLGLLALAYVVAGLAVTTMIVHEPRW